MISTILSAAGLTRTSDEDLCSQFNYLWSAIVLASMGGFITLVQYAGHPISCWCPAEMPEVQCNYTKALCWVKNNYYVHEDQDIVVNQQEIYSESIAYYPWVPWILFFMAAMLKLPHYIWQSFAHTSGLNLVKLIEMADTHDDIENLAKILQIWLIRTCLSTDSKCEGLRHFLGSIGIFWLGKRQRTYLAGLVLFIKFTYLVVSVGLHLSLNFFIDEDFMWYGYEVFENYLRGTPQFLARFPAQTLCDMEVRENTVVNRYTIQCILPINRYSEKIFIFVWFWLLMLIIINGWSLFKWGIRLLSPSDRRRFVQGYVEITLHLMKRQKLRDRVKGDNDSHLYGEDSMSYSSSSTASLQPLITNSIAVVDTNNKPRGRRRKFVQNALNVQNTLNELFANGFVFQPHDLHIEASEQEAIEFEEREKEKAAELKRRKRIDRITSRMLKRFGHDGVVVFRTLEDAVGVIMANQIFQELYVQLNASLHYS